MMMMMIAVHSDIASFRPLVKPTAKWSIAPLILEEKFFKEIYTYFSDMYKDADTEQVSITDMSQSCTLSELLLVIHLFIYYANWQQTQHTQPIQQHRKSTETKFKNRIKLTTIYENHKCSTINHKIHENLKILK